MFRLGCGRASSSVLLCAVHSVCLLLLQSFGKTLILFLRPKSRMYLKLQELESDFYWAVGLPLISKNMLLDCFIFPTDLLY